MNKLILTIFTAVILSFVCVSCSHSEKEDKYAELTELDFGEGTYRPNPFNFLDGIPPFLWMGMPDTVKKVTKLEITFNEDAIRSHSSAQLGLVDKNGNIVKGVTFGEDAVGNITLPVDTGKVILPVSIRVNPAIGDSVLTGSVVVIGNDLDQVNEVKLASMSTPVASWTISQKIGVNWLRWIILILTVILILAAIALIIYLLFKLGIIVSGAVSSAFESHSLITTARFKLNNDRQGNRTTKKDEKKKKKQENKDRNPFIVNCESILLSPMTSLTDKATTLERLFIFWDYDLPDDDKDFEAKELDRRILSAMDELWDKYYKYTKKRMSWSGAELDSMLVPDPGTTPPNKNYSNMDNLTWGEIMNKYNYKGLVYHRGKPDFSNLAVHKIKIYDFDKFVDSGQNSERGPLQEEAFRILAKRLNKTVDQVREYKEINRLVWHEDTDCMTLYLVPQEIHNNLNHFGGIGMLKILRKSGLF